MAVATIFSLDGFFFDLDHQLPGHRIVVPLKHLDRFGHVEVGSLEAVVASMRMHQSDAELQRDGACDSCPVRISYQGMDIFTLPETHILAPEKWMVGRQAAFPFWEGRENLFSEANLLLVSAT